MQITAQLNYLRISPRKVREVTRVVKGMKIKEAKDQLNLISKNAARPLLKLLNSAVQNGENNFQLKKENLYIKNIIVNAGPSLKRFQPRARGAAYEILKRTSKIEIILNEVKPSTKKKIKIKKDKIINKKISDLEESQLKEERKKTFFGRTQKDKRGQRGVKGFFQKVFRRKSG